MLSIRFLKIGKKRQPFFRLIVCDKKNPPCGGKFLEILGFRDPLTKKISLKAERIKYWLSVGAKCSDTVHNLLITEKIIEGKKIPVHSAKKSKGEGEESAEETPKEKTETKSEKEDEKVESKEEPKVEEKEKPKTEEKAKSEKEEEK